MSKHPWPDSSPSDSGITIVAEWPGQTGNTTATLSDSNIASFDRAFRENVAAMILGVLTKGYFTHREYVLREAQRRNMSVEQLLAAYLARKIMDRVDDEYL